MFIAGLRSKNEVSLSSLTKNVVFNKNNGNISITISVPSGISLDYIQLTYIVIPDISFDVEFTKNEVQSNLDYVFCGIDDIEDSRFSPSCFVVVTKRLECVGNECTDKCILQSECTAKKGVIIGKTCMFCNGE